VDGANAARDFLDGRGLTVQQVQLIWDAIALHTTFSLAAVKEPEVAICAAGIGVDIVGSGLDEIDTAIVDAVIAAYPRLALKQNFAGAMCENARRKPETTYDNFVRGWGERYIKGYVAPSPVDMLQNAPYDD